MNVELTEEFVLKSSPTKYRHKHREMRPNEIAAILVAIDPLIAALSFRSERKLCGGQPDSRLLVVMARYINPAFLHRGLSRHLIAISARVFHHRGPLNIVRTAPHV